jgi:hypothetical protein
MMLQKFWSTTEHPAAGKTIIDLGLGHDAIELAKLGAERVIEISIWNAF